MTVTWPVVAMDDPQMIGRDDRQFVVGQIDDFFGVTDQRRRVAGQEVLAFAHADHQRAAEPRGEDRAGNVFE
ncbi:MAG: hypothetical protein QM811_01165 [Pirellulales bacterium]